VDACAWGMEKGFTCPLLSHKYAAILVRAGGEGRGGSDGKQLLFTAGVPHQGESLLERQCCFLLQQLLGRKAFVEHPRISEVLSPSA